LKIAKVYPLPVPIGRNVPRMPGNVGTGGGETYPFMLAKSLSEMGNDVTYFTGKLPGVVDDIVKVGDMKVVYCPLYMFRNFVHHAVSLRLLIDLLKSDSDIYTSWQVPTVFSMITGLVAKAKGKKFIVNHIGLRPEISRSARFYAKVVSKLADKVTIPNRFSKKFFDPYFPESKMVFMPYGISVERFVRTVDSHLVKKYKPRGEKVVLYVGRLVPNKGLDVLIDAVNILSKKDPKVRLLIVGKGDLEGYLRNYAKKAGADKCVHFAGFEYEKLSRYYSMADVTVLPSVYKDRFGNRYPEPEAFGLVLAESMSCGTPVVATEVGGVPYWIRDGYNGLLAKPSDVSDLAKKISRAIYDKKLSKKLSENAIKELGEKYTLDVVAGQYMDILEKEYSS
jgi:glycosyltransferase involved in cell wall biosynthesis